MRWPGEQVEAQTGLPGTVAACTGRAGGAGPAAAQHWSGPPAAAGRRCRYRSERNYHPGGSWPPQTEVGKN